jgi:hypothetical protein
MMKNSIFAAAFLALLALAFFFPLRAWPVDCYINRGCFAVSDPNLVERVCYLYRHEMRMYGPAQGSPFVQTLATVDLHPDPLHAEFVELMLEKKYVVLKTGTQVFSCKYDIEKVRRLPESDAIVNVRPPQFNCAGNMFRFVPVRFVNGSRCYWVAVENTTCSDVPPSPSAFQQDPTSIRND